MLAIGLLFASIPAATANYNYASAYSEERVFIKIGQVFEVLGVNCFTVTITSDSKDDLTLYTWQLLVSKGNGRVYEDRNYTPLELEANISENVTFCQADEIMLKDSIILDGLEDN